MDLLRLTLVIIGLVIVAGIYIKFRNSNDKPVADKNDHIPVLTEVAEEPDLSDFEALSQVMSGRDQVEEYSKQAATSFTAVESTVESGAESLLIVLNIMSPKGHVFSGEDIHAGMTSAGLTHGEHQIYHYLKDNVALFSIANAIEPGFFELSKLESISSPGLSVFMQLPGPLECRQALESLLEVSKRLADALGGELCDESRSVLTQQTISHLKENVENYRLKQQTSQHQQRH